MQVSFENYVNHLTTETPLNVVAQAYLQDWFLGKPIDGGVAYEQILRKITLDGSIHSLHILDKFLDKLQAHLVSDIHQLQQQAKQRNLLLFIGLYTGLTYCYQLNKPAYWLSHTQLTTQYPPLTKLILNDFSYSIAVSYQSIQDASSTFIPAIFNQTTFFPLVTIIERLYPARQNQQNHLPFFGFINNSVANSVEYMIAQFNQPTSVDTSWQIPTTHDNFSTENKTVLVDNFLQQNSFSKEMIADLDNPLIDRKNTVAESTVNSQPNPSINYQRPVFQTTKIDNTIIQQSATTKISPTTQPLHSKQAHHETKQQKQQKIIEQQAKRQEKIAEALANPKLHSGLLKQKKSMVLHKKQDIFSELWQDLQNLSHEQKNCDEKTQKLYISAQRMLNKLDTLLDDIRQKNANNQLNLTQKQQTNLQQAVKILYYCAKQQHTDAMLLLAIYKFRGNEWLGIDKDPTNALNLLEMASKQNDCRAEKLLSKLYFSGQGVPIDNEKAKTWLQLSASHGHPEAKKLLNQLDIAEQLKSSQKDQQVYQKKLGFGVMVLIAFALIILLLFKI